MKPRSYFHSSPKSVSGSRVGKWTFPVAVHFSPEAGQEKGQNLAASAAFEGEWPESFDPGLLFVPVLEGGENE
jgi:hypothetical protein